MPYGWYGPACGGATMKVTILPDATAAAQHAARLVADHLCAEEAPVLGFATGETMRPVYAELVRLHRLGKADFRRATSFNLDEYAGVPPDHPASFARFMQDALFGQVNFAPGAINLIRGDAPDLDEEVRRYERLIDAAGGIGLQLLGIGQNGHIGFNEPGSSFASQMRVTELAPSTRAANAPAFRPDPVPTHAVTMGIETIVAARHCVLLATGTAKASAVARMLDGAVDEGCPATALRAHSATTVILDPAAAALHWQRRQV